MTSETELQEAIANCDREPIHIPGTIQPFGALIAADAKLQQIEFASSTTQNLLGIAAADLIGGPISAVLDRAFSHQARNVLTHRTISKQREVLGDLEFAGKSFQISIHLKDDRSILEFLPNVESGVGEQGALERTRALLADSVALNDFQTALEVSVDNLRISTGFDRVKAYRFLPDGTGEVVAESRASHTDSFLGLRFPASDIPPIARTLYASTPIRVISDIDGIDAPVHGADPGARPLDLSLAILRGTANVHLRYLKNMGVKSSMTLPIVVDGVLWGLFAMHHMKPRVPDPAMLIASELSGKMLSLIIQHTTQIRHQGHLSSCTTIANKFFESDESKLTGENNWGSCEDHLVNAIPCVGMAYIVDDEIVSSGDAPSTSACLSVRDLSEKEQSGILCFDDLPTRIQMQEFGNTGGAMILALESSPKINLILFRNLAIQTVSWAGAPSKKIRKGERGLELSPRNSFSTYAESVEGKSDAWTNDDMEVAAVLHKALIRALNAKNERKDSQARLKLMVQELNHRVRNILTLVQSLSSSSKNSATSLEGYALALEQRIVALAGAHDLLTREDMLGVRLKQIAELELRPYLDSTAHTASLSGPDVVLKHDVSPIIALVLHELTSNAVKYGAFSQTGGRVTLSWELTSTGLCLEWVESGGPLVVKPEHQGFGRSIIEDAIPYEFGGKAQIEFEPTGIRATFSLAHREFETTVEDEAHAKDYVAVAGIDKESTVVNHKPRRSLIVEDNYVIARESKRFFKELGFQEIVAVATIDGALSILDQSQFDFCLLDVNLRGEISEPVAKRLTDLGIPYVFASGYGSEGTELCGQYDVPFLTKPVNFNELQAVLEQLVVGE